MIKLQVNKINNIIDLSQDRTVKLELIGNLKKGLSISSNLYNNYGKDSLKSYEVNKQGFKFEIRVKNEELRDILFTIVSLLENKPLVNITATFYNDKGMHTIDIIEELKLINSKNIDYTKSWYKVTCKNIGITIKGEGGKVFLY